MLQYPTCNHVRTNGTVCQSPALRESNFCYFHQRERQRQDNLRQARTVKLSTKVPARDDMDAEILESLALPVLEDAAAIQVAASAVVQAIASNHIRPRRAGLLLYALQIAALNLPRVRLNLYETDPIAATDPEPIEKLVPFEPVPQQSLARAAMGFGENDPDAEASDE
ncbi:MAG: hypothetical protein ACRD2Q_06880 [Terriglobales bacterium]